MSYYDDSNYGIGHYPDKIASLRNLKIAVPNQVIYQPTSLLYVRADFSRVGDGFSMVQWIWDTISVQRLAVLLGYLGGAESAQIYIRTDVRDGTMAVPKIAFKVYKCTMWKPFLTGKEGTPIVNSPYAIQTVNVQFVDLIEQVGYL